MMNLLIVILGQRKHLPPLLEAWGQAGVPGATILNSAGAFRAQTWFSRLGLGGLDSLFEGAETAQPTLLTALRDDAILERAVAEAERIVGGFDQPHNGVLLVVPMTHALGLHGLRDREKAKASPETLPPSKVGCGERRVSEVESVMVLPPTLVTPDMPLDAVARSMVANPSVKVACVVGDERQLLGLIDLMSLADDLFVHIVPEEFLSEVTDLEEALRYADMSRMRTASDAMKPAIWVKAHETCREAFKRMHDHRLSGLPVVDDNYHVSGYVNLLELLAICSGPGGAETDDVEPQP